MTSKVLSPIPDINALKKYATSKNCAHYIKQCTLVRLEVQNLRVRNEETIDTLLMESINIAYHLGAINAQTLHRVFGIGINLARAEMQRMMVRGLIEPSNGAPPRLEHKGFLFKPEQTKLAKRHKDSGYDEPHTLTDEGLRIIETKRYEPIKLTNETLYFIEPGGVMLPRMTILRDLEWMEQSTPLESFARWFEGEERAIRQIPDSIFGIGTQEEERLDDFLQITETWKPSSVKASSSKISEDGIWLIMFLNDNFLRPATSTVSKVGYWYDNKFHEMKDWPRPPRIARGDIGKAWGIEQMKGMSVSDIEEYNGRIMLYTKDKPSKEFIPKDQPILLPIVANEPQSDKASVRFYGCPAPHAKALEDWSRFALNGIRFPMNEPLTRKILEKALDDMKRRLLDSWTTPDNKEEYEEAISQMFSVVNYIDQERKSGNWLVKYKLDEVEVFADAL